MRAGVVEGFYGRRWSETDRFHFLDQLSALTGATYIYAPKADRSLRREWSTPLGAAQQQELQRLGRHCHGLGLHFGVGISPLGLCGELTASARQLWRQKVAQLVEVGLDELWLLFDDMPVAGQDLAAQQLEIFGDLQQVAGDLRLAVCPSFYCFDPLLEELFGERPSDYWSDLHRGLPPEVDLLWTGNGVLNNEISAADCEAAAAALGRMPLIWDNYPVNDGRKTSDFLHLDAISGRGFVDAESARGHFINPMVQPRLSAMALQGFVDLHHDPSVYEAQFSRQAMIAAQPPAFGELLGRDWRRFQTAGRASLDADECARMQREYDAVEIPAAREICGWLAGDYRFDPEVLND